jgi:hypothetical protein
MEGLQMSAVAKKASFETRLTAIREADTNLKLASSNAYKNGQISASDDETGSNWDNFDRFFKFYNISPE